MNLSITYETIRYYYDIGIRISEYLPNNFIGNCYDEFLYYDRFNYNAF